MSRASRPPLSGGLPSQQLGDAHEVVGCRRKGEERLDPGQPGLGLDPAERLLDALAAAQSDRVAGVPRGAPVDGRLGPSPVFDTAPLMAMCGVSGGRVRRCNPAPAARPGRLWAGSSSSRPTHRSECPRRRNGRSTTAARPASAPADPTGRRERLLQQPERLPTSRRRPFR